MEPPAIPFTASGVLHVHTPKGLRTDAFEWLKSPAKNAKLDFVVAANRADESLQEGRFGDVDFFVEDEVSLPSGELLVVHSHGPLSRLKGEALKKLALDEFEGRANPQDFFSIISHPSHVKTPWTRFDRYTAGLEILNFDSQWVRQLYDAPVSFLGSLVALPFNPFLGALKLLQPHSKDLASWDTMNAVGPGHFGVVSHDLDFDLQIVEGSPFHESLYEKSFKTAQNVLFLSTPLADELGARKKQIYRALREGRSALVFTVLSPFSGNDWTLDCDGARFRSGDVTTLGRSCTFVVKTSHALPYPQVYKLYKNGELANEIFSNGGETRIPVPGRGTYRLEVWARTRSLFHVALANDTPYILYNPIFIN